MSRPRPWVTETGRAAYTVLAWVNGDPAARADEGLARLAALGLKAGTTAEYREVQDVAKIVRRLRGGGGD